MIGGNPDIVFAWGSPFGHESVSLASRMFWRQPYDSRAGGNVTACRTDMNMRGSCFASNESPKCVIGNRTQLQVMSQPHAFRSIRHQSYVHAIAVIES